MLIKKKSILLILAKVFIFLNIFLIDINVFIIPLRFLILFGFIFFSIITYPEYYVKGLTKYRFMLISSILFAFLFFYSVIFRGNEIGNAMFFCKPIMILFTIPGFKLLFDDNYEDTVVSFIFNCIFLLIVYYLFFNVVFVVNPGLAFLISSKHELVSITALNGFPRVIFRNFVFIFVVLSYCMLYKSKRIFILSIVFMFGVILLSQTYGLLFGLISIYLVYLIKTRRYLIFAVLCSLGLIASIYLLVHYREILPPGKIHSIQIKLSQFANVFKDLDFGRFYLGEGIGYIFNGIDERSEAGPVIEVAPVMLFKIGGVVGSLIYLYVYMWPAVKSLLIFKLETKGNQNILLFFSFIQIGIIFSSVANPYIWSGGVGLFFVVLINAYLCSKLISK